MGVSSDARQRGPVQWQWAAMMALIAVTVVVGAVLRPDVPARLLQVAQTLTATSRVQATASPGAPTVTAAAATGDRASPTWKIVWDDEFDGTTLDPLRWTAVDSESAATLGCCLGYGEASWSPKNVNVTRGQLQIVSDDKPLAGRPYTSGAVTTLNTFAFTYGRIDVRAKLPRTDGLWPSFWLLPVHGDTPGFAPYELDFLEAWGSDMHVVHAYYHWDHSQSSCQFIGPDYSADFHTFTLIWSSGSLRWMIDGTERCVVTTHVPDVPMYLNLTTSVGGAERVDSSTQLPQTTYIDYVRVSKLAV